MVSAKVAMRVFRVVLVAAIAGTVAIACARWIGPLQLLDSGLADRIRLAAATAGASQDDRISIIAIDEPTLARLPYRSPIDRGFLAELVTLVGASGAKAIGLDILFDQPTEPEKDARLADAIHAFPGPVVLAWADARGGMSEAQSAWLAQFGQASGGMFGYVNLTVDPDGIVRRHSIRLPDAAPSSFVAALAGRTAPTGADDAWLVAWRLGGADGSPAFQTTPGLVIPLMAANPAVLSGWFKDRIVLIGAVLPQQDRHRTPLSAVQSDAEIPGIVVHAQLLAQLLDDRLAPEPPAQLGLALTLALALLAATIGVQRRHVALKGLAIACLAVGFPAAALTYAFQGGGALPLVAPLLGLLLSGGGALGVDALLAHRERRFVRSAFSHYLAPQLVDALVKHPETLRLGGERRTMSFLFTDIAGFTSLSEAINPEELGKILNEYLDGVSGIIMAHHGVVDKYIGDAVVALFGVPTDDPAHAARAVTCAAAIDTFSEEFRAKYAHVGLGVTRIGVHSGEAIVGNFGGSARFDYTAIGDAMNTAARLEGANKAFGTRLAVSDACLALAAGYLKQPLAVQPIGKIILKGKTEALAVSTINAAATAYWLMAYNAAYDMLETAPAQARQQLEELGDDSVVQLHLARLDAGETGQRMELTEK